MSGRPKRSRALEAIALDEIARSKNDRYSRLSKIGQGSFKTVYKAIDEEEGMEVAWVEVDLASKNQKSRDNVFREVEVIKDLDHDNIIKPLDIWWDDKRLVFITELMSSGTLKDFVKQHSTQKMRKKVMRRMCRQIVVALIYLHSRQIIHRDLKCDNVFLNGSRGEVKIGDFGLSLQKVRSYAESVIGTPEFMAPELYDEKYTEKVDVYSFGMCLLEMATGSYPYDECENVGQVFKKVTSRIPPDALKQVEDPEVKEVIVACLQSSESRPASWELLEFPFLAENCGGSLALAASGEDLPARAHSEVNFSTICRRESFVAVAPPPAPPSEAGTKDGTASPTSSSSSQHSPEDSTRHLAAMFPALGLDGSLDDSPLDAVPSGPVSPVDTPLFAVSTGEPIAGEASFPPAAGSPVSETRTLLNAPALGQHHSYPSTPQPGSPATSSPSPTVEPLGTFVLPASSPQPSPQGSPNSSHPASLARPRTSSSSSSVSSTSTCSSSSSSSTSSSSLSPSPTTTVSIHPAVPENTACQYQRRLALAYPTSVATEVSWDCRRQAACQPDSRRFSCVPAVASPLGLPTSRSAMNLTHLPLQRSGSLQAGMTACGRALPGKPSGKMSKIEKDLAAQLDKAAKLEEAARQAQMTDAEKEFDTTMQKRAMEERELQRKLTQIEAEDRLIRKGFDEQERCLQTRLAELKRRKHDCRSRFENQKLFTETRFKPPSECAPGNLFPNNRSISIIAM
eukprot:NODE_258_length_2377_cov_49.049828_g203_i0.p1 GENE.NODE_258_length_2377_cov_49.049828_g203_i0~~NODE_258_length_2377_cov_49.049828_g203_i0.p1  ORF type:complete len:738 (-),score=138.11 NODE_258_length_2377_cov_49.049828_g203_i0:33-2246(-)